MSEPVPQRIGDAERDRAAGYLQEHLAQGRLSQEEFDERVGSALAARTAADLTPLFSDLPAPRPDEAVTDPQPRAGSSWPAYAPPAGVPAQIPAAEAGPSTEPAPAPGPRPPTALTVLAAVAWPAWLLVMFATSWHFWWLVFVPVMISSIVARMYGDQGRNRISGRDRDRYRRRRLEQ